MRFFFGGLVILFMVALAAGALTGRVRARNCCSLKVAAIDRQISLIELPRTGPVLGAAQGRPVSARGPAGEGADDGGRTSRGADDRAARSPAP
jgi:hypothetical protein